jgi:predicted acylesterase/phospholipase RssA
MSQFHKAQEAIQAGYEAAVAAMDALLQKLNAASLDGGSQASLP